MIDKKLTEIVIGCDRVSVSGPRESDGSYKITFTTGEYQKENIARLITLPNDVEIELNVKIKEC